VVKTNICGTWQHAGRAWDTCSKLVGILEVSLVLFTSSEAPS
jgi:hypothetical protein